MSGAPGLDWPQLMRLGLGVLGLSPDTFWAMTPVELTRALEGAGVIGRADHRMTRDGLDQLMAAFPDAPSNPTNEEI